MIIGELNPYSADPSMALYPYPARSAGWRLCHLVLGMSKERYLNTFRRENMCSPRWSDAAAARRAVEIRTWVRRSPRRVILLGRRVSNAFGIPFVPLHVAGHYIILPHPSGRCLWWNDENSYAMARRALGLHGVPVGNGIDGDMP